MIENPYTTTLTTSLNAIPEPRDVETSLLPIARGVFLAWEKLRVVYLIILALITILLTVAGGVLNLAIVRTIILGAVFANVAYFAGPTVETYVRWLGYNRNWPRWVMFICGMLISIILTIGVLAAKFLPDQP